MQSVYSTNLLLCNKESGREGESGVGGEGRDHFSGLQVATLPSTSAVTASSVNLEAANITPNFAIGSGSGNLHPRPILWQSMGNPFLSEDSPSAVSFLTPSLTDYQKRTHVIKKAVRRGKR